MTTTRKKKPLAKALSKKTYQFGAPLKILLLGFIPGLLVLIFTQGIWEVLPLGFIWLIWAKIKFEKDPLYFEYLINCLFSANHLEP